MSHANAALTPRPLVRLVRAVVEDRWSVSYAAAVCDVAWATAERWSERSRTEGRAGMVNPSSRTGGGYRSALILVS